MKRLILAILCILPLIPVQAQFERYFKPQTLCIRYLHSGDFNRQSYRLKDFVLQGQWAGSTQHLIDPFSYGRQKVEVRDVATDSLLYSCSFNSLFDEYRTTKEGRAGKRKSFREYVRIPMPIVPVIIRFYSRNAQFVYEKRWEVQFEPGRTKMKKILDKQPCRSLHVVEEPSKAYDILLVPEGYAFSDTAKWRKDAERCAEAILNCSPFKENAYRINIRALCEFYVESGVSRDGTGKRRKKTLLGASFYTLGTERYLMVEDMWRLASVCGLMPYDHVLVICNTRKYGGGGIYNFHSTVTDNRYFNYVCVHELGHGIAGLADEYYTSDVAVQDYYPQGTEPPAPNITSLVNFDAKWRDMLDPEVPVPTPAEKQYEDDLGVFEGAGYCAKGLYRPRKNCTMKDIRYDYFCPVCQRAFQRMFDHCCDK
ncbi:MAG: peptidase M64 [Bacteroidales bacterium]|nr:peptidase M64 [Bacteroidales bacterium]